MVSAASHPALALIELSSIGRGIRVLDVVAKKAEVTVHTATPVSSGKYLLVFTGEVADVEESLKEGLVAGATTVIHKLFLANVHPGVVAAMAGLVTPSGMDAVAIVELLSLATAVSAADAAAKAAEVSLLEIRLGQGIGGKGFFTLTGSQADVEAAVAAATAVAERDGFLADVEVIPRPHADLIHAITRRRA